MCQNGSYKKECFYGTLERSYFGDAFDRDRQSIPFSLSSHRESSLAEFCSVRDMSNSLVFADRTLPQPGSVEILVVVSAMSDGLVPL